MVAQLDFFLYIQAMLLIEIIWEFLLYTDRNHNAIIFAIQLYISKDDNSFFQCIGINSVSSLTIDNIPDIFMKKLELPK